jgi:hypothetical protein
VVVSDAIRGSRHGRGRDQPVEHFFTDGSRDAWAAQLTRPFTFKSPCEGEDVTLLLVAFDESITADEQSGLSDEFVKRGCRYAVCAGSDCSSWSDSIDMGYLATDPGHGPLDERFVMTSWHDDEPLEAVAEFFVQNTSFDRFEARRFLVVCLGGEPAAYERTRDAVRRVLAHGPSVVPDEPTDESPDESPDESAGDEEAV